MEKEPDLKLAGLSLRVLGRQFPDQDDYWDGNWLNVSAQVEASGAVVEVTGPIIHVPELASFVEALDQLERTQTGSARLECLEPNLDVLIRLEAFGHATLQISITPDHMTQTHEFTFSIDQTFFRPTLTQCRKIISDYPIRGQSGN